MHCVLLWHLFFVQQKERIQIGCQSVALTIRFVSFGVLKLCVWKWISYRSEQKCIRFWSWFELLIFLSESRCRRLGARLKISVSHQNKRRRMSPIYSTRSHKVRKVNRWGPLLQNICGLSGVFSLIYCHRSTFRSNGGRFCLNQTLNCDFQHFYFQTSDSFSVPVCPSSVYVVALWVRIVCALC